MFLNTNLFFLSSCFFSSVAVTSEYSLIPEFVLQASTPLSLFMLFSLLERSYTFSFLEIALPSETNFHNKSCFYTSQENRDLLSFILINFCSKLLLYCFWYFTLGGFLSRSGAPGGQGKCLFILCPD
jgi:hypothetical protein